MMMQDPGAGPPLSRSARPGELLTERASFAASTSSDVHRVATLDLSGRIIAVDSAAPDGPAVLNLSLVDLWSPEGHASAEAALATARLGRIGRFIAESAARGRFWEVVVAPVMGRDASPEGLIAIGRDVTSAKRERDVLERTLEELEFLGGVGRILATTLDSEAMVRDVARLCVQSIADLCVVELRQPDGRLAPAAMAHADPLLGARLLALHAGVARSTGAPDHPIVSAAVRDASTFVPDVEEAGLIDAPCCAVHGDLIRTLEYRSLVVVPFATPHGCMGALTLVLAGETSHRFDERDLALAEEIARRIGIALENARRYSHERVIATTLQEAALPPALPAVAGFAFDAVYAPGRDEATIGGDWYDAVRLADGRIAVTIGDVEGNGLRAAVTMIKIRQAMQSTALLRADPLEMLAAANLTLVHHDPNRYATALAAVLDRERGELIFACAGHPAPLVRDPDGTVREEQCEGTMLGVGIFPSQVSRIALPPGTVVALFTDGLIEATRDLEAGYALLCGALASPDLVSSARPARTLFNRVLRTDPIDDVAILTLTAKG